MTDQFPFVIDSFPRTGSTTLVRILNSHPDIACCMEPFHPHRFSGSYHQLALQSRDIREPLDLIRLRWNGLKHVWEPGSGWPFVGRSEINDKLVEATSILVSLRRRNLLKQVVSNHISKSIGFWVGTKQQFEARLDRSMMSPITCVDAAKTLSEYVRAQEIRDGLLKQTSVKTISLYYEDLFPVEVHHRNSVQLFNSLFVNLGHSKLNEELLASSCDKFLEAATYRWADRTVYERVPGITEIEKSLGCAATGWLLK